MTTSCGRVYPRFADMIRKLDGADAQAQLATENGKTEGGE